MDNGGTEKVIEDPETVHDMIKLFKEQQTICEQFSKITALSLIATIALIVVLGITTIGWWILWNEYDHVYVEECSIEQDGEGINSITTYY